MCHNSDIMLPRKILLRLIYGMVILCAISATVSIGILLESKSYIFSYSTQSEPVPEIVVPFPVSVNQFTQVISEDPTVNLFFRETLAQAPTSPHHWWNQIAAVFSSKNWYQNLASPVSRIVVIWPGERKEEVIKNLGDILRWDSENRDTFQALMDDTTPLFNDGKYYPGQYVTHRSATPEDMYKLITEQFKTEILSRYTQEVATKVPLRDALIIASLLEREASDFQNMREVSGVIWNRLFINMPLQLDASLQYARGSNSNEVNWWPAVKPQDKFLDSPFNTYQNKGLPPEPIANPSAEAVLAALNPVITDCLYYFHTNSGKYYCSKDYEGHVEKLRELYGQGK